MDFVPNDTLVNEQWALEKIQAFDAWDKTEGDTTVLLAVIAPSGNINLRQAQLLHVIHVLLGRQRNLLDQLLPLNVKNRV